MPVHTTSIGDGWLDKRGGNRLPIDIFISYRRADSAGHARSVRTALLQWFDESQIFFDQETIPAGVEFAREISTALAQCRVVLVIVGPAWLTAEREGRRRLFDAGDLVRQEVGRALADRKHIIPVLMDGARMPEAGQLPQELAALAAINAHVQGSGKTFDDDVERMAELISQKGVVSRPRGLNAEREKLPLLCDRRDQHRAISETVGPLVGSEQRRPLVLVLHGRSNEEHWAFVQRLEIFSMPRALNRTSLSPGEGFVWINDPPPVDCDQDSFDRRLRADIAARLMFKPIADDEALLGQVKHAKRSTLIAVLSWHVDELGRLSAQALQRVFNYWARFPAPGPGVLTACIVCLKYDGVGQRVWWRKLFGAAESDAVDDPEVAALKAVVRQSALSFSKDPRVAWIAPPELPQVTLADLERWREDVRVEGGVRLSSDELAAVLEGKPRSMDWVLPRLEDLVIRI